MKTWFTEVSDGYRLHTVLWESNATEIKGSIQLCHGMAEHIGRYQELAEALNKDGYHVFGYDNRGHGKTATANGRHGDFDDDMTFDRLALDCVELRESLLREVEGPLFMIGHSMGSFITRRMLQLNASGLKGVVLSGTSGPLGLTGPAAVALASVISAYKPDEKAELLDHLSFGGYNKAFDNPKTPFDWLSRDEQSVRLYVDDPECGFVCTNRFYKVLFEGMQMISQKKEVSKVPEHIPILLVSGTKDPVGNFTKGIYKTAASYQKAGIRSVEVLLYEDGRHEMLNELNRKEVISDMLKRINQWNR
ncbi:alpha/beta hydrolase [Jeotgalibacillus sp. R-1-5s-1]|uniref:alpha/beta hydrolase n=1 Tax=Jeotgalibacillus sp. R-1-5s-1 TaxID=2555897 RepID=UPI00106BB30B|nr:alpha/beta hydrolase [Jeotgalibacillus sp. R-1-5s-1]TFE03410.1 alpha/beta fold hydrolase [Jeotgalibacillus sp. R-1-5s-1]